ncbi:MAG: hydantoinase/oxoprolinase family protein [Pseudomonadota bacterium]
MRVGVEVGGTFTDLVAVGDGKIIVTKVPSTPHSPDIGALNALIEAKLALNQVQDLAHGSTVATNAVLERKGARIAFVTTAGFRDILFLQRHDRRSIYDIAYAKPQPVMDRRDCFEVAGRLLADGSQVEPLNEAEVRETLVPALAARGYKAVAICLLNAYANPDQEIRLGQLLEEALPDLLVTRSSEVVRVFREFERASTTALSAYVQPVIDRYLGRFERALTDDGFGGHLTVMQSNGGRLPATAMRRSAITALFSGPAAGVVGAARQAGKSGLANLITFDMGGTSTDVCLVEDGRPALTMETEIGGLPVMTPVLDIVTVGGGGGSIAWIDEGGMLRVGPQSAGADPGPACYGKGGELPTVTDAQVVRGAVRPEAFLGGRMAIDVEAARKAFTGIAEHFGMSIDETAESVVRLVNSNIVRAIQLVSTERGRDPRDYALVPFGGGGPLHAAAIAEELGINTICVPPNAGVISAYGLLASDFVKFASRTQKMPLEAGPSEGAAAFKALREELLAEFQEMGLSTDPLIFTYTADMRFVGQAFELGVALPAERLESVTVEDFRHGFEEAHYRMFYHKAGPNRPIEIVSLRVGATYPAESIPDMQASVESGDGESELVDHPLFDAGEWAACQHLANSAMKPGLTIDRLTIIEGSTATTLVPKGWRAEMDDANNLIMKRSEPS